MSQFGLSSTDADARRIEGRPVWKNPVVVALLAVLPGELVWLAQDLVHSFDGIGIREVVIVLLIAGSVGAARLIKDAARGAVGSTPSARPGHRS